MTLDLDLGPDEEGLVDISALVVHVRKEAFEPSARGCGVMFIRLEREQVERLQRLVLSQMESALS